MRGVFFTELLDLVEARHGVLGVERVREAALAPRARAYTAAGSYDYDELERLIAAAAAALAMTANALKTELGAVMMRRLMHDMPFALNGCDDALAAAGRIAELAPQWFRSTHDDEQAPSLVFSRLSDEVVAVDYRSRYPFADVAEGSLRALAALFAEPVDLVRQNAEGPPGCGARFVLRRRAPAPVA